MQSHFSWSVKITYRHRQDQVDYVQRARWTQCMAYLKIQKKSKSL